ncbi:DoxX family protein [Flavisolibacter tropicus]|uniref:DoxX family protein n=1 Tax=Flavisolibacter tropicus TaxID=1492898 RepID=A0A172TQL2_9BACT|nr:DoxX family protein [Flavisolibacter tropicus]ANE49361.1 DoxX family protein [Flavisolibacter tropicus]
MNILQRMELWGDRHHPKWLDIIRIALGIFLFIKGIEFYNNLGSMMSMMENQVPFGSLVLIFMAHYVIFAHIVGGLFLAFGIFTRVACIAQIPVLLGAIIFINSKGEMFRPFSELILSVLVLLLLIFFLVVGNGPWSAEHYFDEKKAESQGTV